MKKRRNAVTVPLSQTLGLGRRDTSTSARDSQSDKRGTDEPKRSGFSSLQRDTEWDSERTGRSEACPRAARQLGQSGTGRATVSAEIREWIDRVIVPALVRDFLAEPEVQTSENLQSVGDCLTSSGQSSEGAK